MPVILNIRFPITIYIIDKNGCSEFNGQILFNELPLRYGFIDHYYKSLANGLANNRKVNIERLTKSFNVKDAQTIINELYFSGKDSDAKEQYIHDLIKEQKLWIKRQIEGLKRNTMITWVTENPTTQLTSSFNPIIKEPKEWYGEYYSH